MQHRGATEEPWITSHYSKRPILSTDRLPDLHLSHLGASEAAGYASEQGYGNKHFLASKPASQPLDTGLRTPSPSPTSQSIAPSGSGVSDPEHPRHFAYAGEQYSLAMNQQQPNYMDAQHAMSAGQQYAPHVTTANSMSQYPPYQHHQSPSVLPPHQSQYTQSPASYGPQYGYAAGMTSPQGGTQSSTLHLTSGLPPLPTISGGHQHYVGSASAPSPANYSQQQDPSGQVAPAGMKPRVTATLWEDEGCMCFQVETKGVCVARRDDNHMINGTKLLNVAGMTRGRRDGILKSEKTRHVVKIGPMHLKGVWIPFERALDFANKEKITESLYPLFVHNIGALLYHPTNQNRTSQVMAAHQQDRRRSDKLQGGVPSAQQTPSLTHHPSINSSSGGQQSASIAPNPAPGRPGLDRASTFPTPPTSASGTIHSMGPGHGSYDWTNGNMGGNVPTGQAMGLDNHPHSTPATPAPSPPNSALPSLQRYQSQQQIYAGHAGSHTQYQSQQQGIARSQSLSSGMYPKQEMGPPSRMTGSRSESDHGDVKLDSYGQAPVTDNVQSGGDAEGEHEQETEYPQSNAQAYGSHRGSFDAYNAASNMASYNADNAHMPSDVSGSASVNGGSGRVTPRTSQSQWAAGYQTPPSAPPSSNLYNPTSDARGTLTNGNSHADSYVTGAYAPTQMNGVKRMRDVDEAETLKRQKLNSSTNNTLINGTFDNENRPMNRARTTTTKPTRVR